MGYDPEYFLCHSSNNNNNNNNNNSCGRTGLDESLICVVCHAVYDSPMVLDPCGHSFCRECVASLLDSGHENCPICRTRMIEGVGVGVPPNRALKELIGNLEIKCMNASSNSNNDSNSSSDNDNDNSNNSSNNSSNSNSNSNSNHSNNNNNTYSCSWTGKLSEFCNHSKKDCPLRRVSCPLSGCSWEGPHYALEKHNVDAVAMHTDLLIASKMNQIKEELMRSCAAVAAAAAGSNINVNTNDDQNTINSTTTARLDELENRLAQKDREIQTLKARLLDNWLSDNFVRDWIVAKPTYFRDFCVYRPIQHLTGPISQIIVGIPGPRNTDWQDGLYPLLVTFTPEGYERKEPPKCDFPEDFFHPNVYEGNVHVNTLVEFEGL